MNTRLTRIIAACLLSIGLATGAQAESLTTSCEGGGSKQLTYNWTPVNGAVSYSFTLQNCRPDRGDDRTYNGTMNGSGTLRVISDGFDMDVTSTDALTVTGVDSGSINCTRHFAGTLRGSVFEGEVTMSNCVANGRYTEFNLIEALSFIPFE